MESILVNLLTSEHGIRVKPKRDGRVEVPQNLVKAVGWDKRQVVFISKEPGVLTLCGSRSNLTIGKTKVSKGRVRIPAGILKSVEFIRKPLVLSLGKDYISARVCCEDKIEDIKQVIGRIQQPDIEELSSILIGKKEFVEPQLFLLQDGLVVQPIRPPFKFFGYYLSTKEVVYINPDETRKGDIFFLLPVIKFSQPQEAERFKLGFLLLNEYNYATTYKTLHRARVDCRNPNRSLIFLYRPFTFGMWSVFINPPGDMPVDIQKANNICKDPERFLRTFFRQFEKKDLGNIVWPPPSITKTTVERFKCRLKIG